MKTTWLQENMWIIFFIIVFILGFVFIVWMGNSRLDNSSPSLAKQMIEREIIQSTNIIKPILPGSLSNKLLTPKVITPSSVKVDTSAPSPSPSPSESELDASEANDLCPTLLIKRGTKYMLFNKNMPEEVGENPIYFDSLEQYINYVDTQRKLYNQSCPVLFLQEEVNAQGEDVYRMRELSSNGNVDPLLLGSIQDYFLSKTNVTPKFGPPIGPQAFNQPPTNNGISLADYGVPLEQLQTSAMQPPRLVPYEDANRAKPPYNQGYYGFDPTSQYVGKYTVLDQIHDSTKTENADGLSNNPMDPNWGGVLFTAEKVASGVYEGNSVQPPTVPTVLQNTP